MIEFVKSTYKCDRRVFFNCPVCGQRDSFFLINQAKCDFCKELLPDIKNILGSMTGRAKYHCNGKDKKIIVG